LKFGVHSTTGSGYQSGSLFPSPDALPAFSFLFEQVDSSPEDINLALYAQLPLEDFDPAIILFLNHQWSAHINLQIYKKIYHPRAARKLQKDI
jgi:hypothetical protein